MVKRKLLTTKKDFEAWLNKECKKGMKINGLHPSYYTTHVNLRKVSDRGTVLRKYNKEVFDKLHKKFDKTAAKMRR